MKKRKWLALGTVLLLLTGCMSKPVDSSSEVQPSQLEVSSSEEADSLKETQGPKFVKFEAKPTADFRPGVLVLDSNGDLYFGADNNSWELLDTNVKDFSSTASSLYVLKENGDLMSSGIGGYRVGQPLSLFYHDEDAQKVSDSILMRSDGSLLSYQFENDSWNPIDINAAYVDAAYFGAGIIDTDGILWYLDRQTGVLHQIAENVMDCSYTDWNKVYYSSDIWYITTDHTMHLYHTEPQVFQTESQVDSPPTFPEDVDAISGAMGLYLAKKASGNIVSGSLFATANDTGIVGQDIDIFGIYYVILDENGEFHLGEIQSDDCFIETQRITHP